MDPKNAERIGKLADELDAVLYSAKMPLPPTIHLTALTEKIRDARNVLVEVFRAETGEDPWADNRLVG